MSNRASRYLGLFALIAMLAVLAAPIGSGTVLGQENDVTVDETLVAEVTPTATSPSERLASDESPAAQTDPPIEQTVPPPLPATTDIPTLTETAPVGETAIPAETAPPPSETSAAIQAAEETPNPAALVEIQASFSASHCEHSDDTWTFIVSNQVAANWNPGSIVVQFDGEADLVVSQQATSESNGVFSSYYFTSEFLDGDLVGATATVDASVIYEFYFAGGPACPPGPLATDTATATGPTQTSTPSATATATVTPTGTPTLTGNQLILEATFDLCTQSEDGWEFLLINSEALSYLPVSITVTFSGDVVVVPLAYSLGGGGAFYGVYRWAGNLSETVDSATAVVETGPNYHFSLSKGPNCAPTQATSTPTVTSTSTASATASSTNTASPTTTPSSTASATVTPTTRIDPPTLTPTRTTTVWPTHTPKPEPSATPPPGKLPGTGAGSAGSSGGVLAMTAIALLALLGCAVRRRNRIGA